LNDALFRSEKQHSRRLDELAVDVEAFEVDLGLLLVEDLLAAVVGARRRLGGVLRERHPGRGPDKGDGNAKE
jgi:hypothetical protein